MTRYRTSFRVLLSLVLAVSFLAPAYPHPATAAATAQASGRFDVLTRGSDHALWQKTFDGSRWGDWQRVGGYLTAEPAAVRSASGQIDVFIRGGDYGLWHIRFDGTAWGSWEPLGGQLGSAPAVSSWAPGHFDVFAVSFDRAMYVKTFDNGTWGRWRNLGGQFSSSPAAVSWSPGRIDVFGRGLDLALYHSWYSGRWSGTWEYLGGQLGSSPGVASWTSNRLDVFANGTDRVLYHRWWDGSRWGGWEWLGGYLTGDPGVASPGSGRVDVFVRGGDAAIWHKWWNYTYWSAWESIGGAAVAGTEPLPIPSGRSRSPFTEWTRIPTSQRVVALTFDAGSGDEGLRPILATLTSKAVPASFFLTGLWVDAFPEGARLIASHADYSVGNHSYDHPYLTSLPNANVSAELASAEYIIKGRTGRSPLPLFRFPYGDRDSRSLSLANSLGYGSIYWTVDTLGWKGKSAGQSVDTVISRVIANLQPGEIVLMHLGAAPDGSTLDADALPSMIDQIRAKGYSLVAVGSFIGN